MTRMLYGWGGKWLLKWYYRIAYGQRKRLVERLVHPGKLLDIGCESGNFLAQFGSKWMLSGVEINKTIARQAQSRLPQAAIYDQAIEQAKLVGKFDVLTMWHVLEHLDDPKTVIQQCAKLLKPGGVIVIEVPNGNSAYMRWFGAYWRMWMYPEHKWFFTQDALRLVVEKCGLQIIEVRYSGLLSSGPGSLADKLGSPLLGLISIPVFVAMNLFMGTRRDNLRVVARRG